jgi:uncharacterized protein YacL
MRILRFVGWLGAATSFFLLLGGSIHLLFAQVFPPLGITGNRAVAGAYTMELVVSIFAFILVSWRILWALEMVNKPQDLLAVIKTRAALLSFGIAGMIGMGFINRSFWWVKHMMTDTAYNYVKYTGAANSVLVSLLLCILVYAINADPAIEDQESGISSGLSISIALWGVGVITFMIGMSLYSIRP